MKKIFLFFAAVLFCTHGYADLAVTVNSDGSATQAHFPVYGDNVTEYGHKVQAIYLANQLTGITVGSEIKALTFYSANQTQSWGKAEFKVSLAQTDFSNFPAVKDNYATASTGSTLTEVYEGTLAVADGELTINFTTPYAYEGGNLLIQLEVSRTGSGAISSFYSAANTDYLIRYAKSASSRDNKQPKVTFVIAGGESDPVSQTCAAPTAVTVSSVTDATATVSWEGEASQYQYCVELEGNLPDWTAATLTSQKSVTVSGLYDEQKYYFYVRSYCSATAVSETVRTTFKTACARLNVPWIETFTRDAAGSSTAGDVAPECWTVSSAAPAVTIVAEKQDDGNGNQKPTGQQYLTARGGGATSAQVFALPLFNAQLDTCELAFDYRTTYSGEAYGSLIIGYMTNPADASTFVPLDTLAQTTADRHVVFPLNNLPAGIEYIAFRFAGGSNNYGGVAMDNFILAGIGHSAEIDPADEDVPDAAIYDINYAVASFTWYSYTAEAFGIGLFDATTGERIAGIVVTSGECDRFANADSVMFSQYDDYENKYYCSTKWILAAEGVSKGTAWANAVINIGTSASPVLGLNPGQYQVQVYAYTQSESSLGELLATIPFELVSKEVTGLQAVVSDDKTKATLSWTEPELGTGERLYVSVRSGESVAYDNFTTKELAASPMEIAVEEGKTYTATIQILDRKNNPLGHEVAVDFTVGVNSYEPLNPTATVANGDVATFTWGATTQADAYVIVLYLEGEFYTSMDVVGATTKTTYMPADGTWSWTVQALNKGANDKYFPASAEVAGNDFTVQIPDIPSGAIEANPWEIQAAYYPTPADDPDYRAGKYVWFINLLCGTNGSAYPAVSAIVYTDKEYGISGTYSTALNNVYYGEDLTFMALTNGGSNIQRKTAASLEMTLSFEGYDQEHFDEGYRFGRYSGKYVLRTEEGETYAGRFQDIFCNSFNAEYLLDETGTVQQQHVGMWDEDPDGALQAIESVAVPTDKAEKILHNGVLYILRPDGTIHTATGLRVR